jgi:hypothetical protein
LGIVFRRGRKFGGSGEMNGSPIIWLGCDDDSKECFEMRHDTVSGSVLVQSPKNTPKITLLIITADF